MRRTRCAASSTAYPHADHFAVDISSCVVRLYAIPTGPEEMPDIKIDSWQLPEYVSESEPILGKLVLSGSIDTTGTVYLYQDNKLIRELKNRTLFWDKQMTLTVELPAQEKVISI